MAKCSRLVKQERLNQIYGLMIAGWPTVRILQYIANPESGFDKDHPEKPLIWGIRSVRTRDWYMAQARQRVAETAQHIREHLMEDMLARHAEMRSVLWGMLKVEDILEIDREDAKLLGLYGPARNLNLNIDMSIFSTEQLERIAAGEDIVIILQEVEAERAARQLPDNTAGTSQATG